MKARSRQKLRRYATTVCGLALRCCVSRAVKKAWRVGAMRLTGAPSESRRQHIARQLIQRAACRRPIRTPPHEASWLPKPTAAIKQRKGDLCHGRGRDRSPGRYGVVLPTRADGSFFRTNQLENRCTGIQECSTGARNAEVVLGTPLSCVRD